MEISLLIKDVEVLEVQGRLTGMVSSVCYDSRKCTKDSLFVALCGLDKNGHDFINDAVSRGARFIVHEEKYHPSPDVTAIKVRDSRLSLGRLARNYFHNPSSKITLIGVTGTNGKTTCTYLLESILRSSGAKVGVLGTVNYRYDDRVFPAPNTTPESYEIQKILGEMVKAGVTHAVAEVSSHALDLKRVDDCSFDLVIFTNLSQDHLDYHGSMENYYQAKKRLFSEIIRKTGKTRKVGIIVNTGDAWGKRLKEEVALPCLTYGRKDEADIFAREYGLSHTGISAEVRTLLGDLTIKSSLLGKHNLENILAAIAASLALDVPVADIKRGIEELTYVPGRLEKINRPQEPTVFVDYAHTEDALYNTIANLAEFKTGKIITVFGCGGDRDRSKRPKMGSAATSLSDLTIITSDNPRSEDPVKIIEDIKEGIDQTSVELIVPEGLCRPSSGKQYLVEVDRRKAIALALAAAGPEDIVLIAGKGHETYQLIGRERLAFDDRTVARELLDLRGKTDVGCHFSKCAEEGLTGASPVLNVADILGATGGYLLQGRLDAELHGISTDSRGILPGNLFVPIRGERFNGHDFLAAALAGGAKGFLFQADCPKHTLPTQEGIVAIRVPDTLVALGDLANFWRRQFDATVIAITGSSGKSTVKEMTASILGLDRRTMKTEGNFNNLVGLPLTLFRMHKGHEVAVVELGMNMRGEIGRLTRIAQPDIGVITNIGPAHLENLGSLEMIREEKGDIFRSMSASGLAVINRDDEAIRIIERSWPGRRITFGLGDGADVRATAIALEENRRITFTLWIGGEASLVTLPVAGWHNVSNALAAAACAWSCGVSLEVICQGLESFEPMAGRMSISQLGNGICLIDDAYNANPSSMREAFKTLNALKGENRAIAVLGDMLELGGAAEAYHEEIGLLAGRSNLRALFLKGSFVQATAAGAVKGGMSPERIRYFEQTSEVIEYLQEHLRPGDWVLIKGSRRMRLENTVTEVRKICGI